MRLESLYMVTFTTPETWSVEVVTHWTIRGTPHQGKLMGIAPTEKQIELKGITIHRIEEGKIAEEWERYDNLGMMQQLGVVAEAGQGDG